MCEGGYFYGKNPTNGVSPDPSGVTLTKLTNAERYTYDPSVFNFTVNDGNTPAMPICALNGEDCFTMVMYGPTTQDHQCFITSVTGYNYTLSYPLDCNMIKVVSLGDYPVIIARESVPPAQTVYLYQVKGYDFTTGQFYLIANNGTGVITKGTQLTYSEEGIIYLYDLSTKKSTQPYKDGTFISSFNGDEIIRGENDGKLVRCDYGGTHDESTILPFTPEFYSQGEFGMLLFTNFYLAYIDEYYCSAVYPYYFTKSFQITTAWIKDDSIFVYSEDIASTIIIRKAECQANFLSAYPVQNTTDIYGNETSLYAVQCPENPQCAWPFKLEGTSGNFTCAEPPPNPAPIPSPTAGPTPAPTPVDPDSPSAICNKSQYYRFGCQNHTRCANYITFGNINTPRKCRPITRCTGYIYNGTCYPFTKCNIEIPGNETHDHICKRPDGLWNVPELCGLDEWAYFAHGSFQSCVKKSIPKICSNGQMQNRFGQCPDVGGINVSTCVEKMTISIDLAANQFDGCQDLTEVVLLSTVKVVGTESFMGTVNLRKVVFPTTPIIINSSAFAHSGIEYLDLKGPAVIFPYAFLYSNITTIEGKIESLNIDALSFTPQLTSVPIFTNANIIGRQFFETSVNEFHCINCTFVQGTSLLGGVELKDSLKGTNSLGEPLDPTLSSPGVITHGIFENTVPPFLYSLDLTLQLTLQYGGGGAYLSSQGTAVEQLNQLKQLYDDVMFSASLNDEDGYDSDLGSGGYDPNIDIQRIGKSITDINCTINATAANSIVDLTIINVDTFNPSVQAVLNVQHLTLINVKNVDSFTCSNVRTLKCENTNISDFAFANSPIEVLDIATTHEIGFASFANTLVEDVDFNDHISIGPYAFSGSNINTTSLSFCSSVDQTSFDLTICCGICNYSAGTVLDNCTVSINPDKTCANCTSIEPGTFTEEGQCMPCNGFCTVGQYAEEYCDNNVNIICKSCPPGTYQNHISHRYSSCEKSKCSKSLVDDKCPPQQSRTRMIVTIITSSMSGVLFIVYVQSYWHKVFHYGNKRKTAP